MMAVETKPWDAAELLNTPEEIAAYLDAYLEDGTPEEIRAALRTIARSRGMATVAEQTGLKRESLYKALGENGNPTMDTLFKVIRALGLQLTVKVPEAA
jgi:probable addiction module antidote protein